MLDVSEEQWRKSGKNEGMHGRGRDTNVATQYNLVVLHCPSGT